MLKFCTQAVVKGMTDKEIDTERDRERERRLVTRPAPQALKMQAK